MSRHLEVGFGMSAEEDGPVAIVDQAVAAEQAGFRTMGVSDHFHPWVSSQGNSPMVWPVLGGIAARTSAARIGTTVTCPILRTHPAIIAQAAATTAAMAEGRFYLGVGTGENLNEHVLGQPWPPPGERLARLAEAVDVMRQLWGGETVSYEGAYYRVDRAKLYTLPDELPPVYVSAFGDKALQLAAEIGDGLIGTSPDGEVVKQFDEFAEGPTTKLAYDKVCWGESKEDAERLLYERWPTGGLQGQLSQELPTVATFEDAVAVVSQEDAVGSTPCGPDVEPYLAMLEKYDKAGYDVVCLHQVGPDQAGWLRFWERELEPAWREAA